MFLPKDKKDKVKFLLHLYRGVKEQMKPWLDNAQQNLNLYESYMNEDEYPLRFSIFLPLVFSTIETIVPRYVNGLLYRHPLVSVNPVHPMTPWESVQAADRILNKKWLIDQETWVHQLDMVREHLKVGCAPGKIVFKRRKRKMVTREPLTFGGSTMGHMLKETYVNVINRPVLLSRSIFNVFPDLDNPTPSDMRFVFEDMIKPMDELWSSGLYDPGALNELEELPNWQVDDSDLKRRFKDFDKPFNQEDVMDPFKPRKVTEIVFREYTKEGEIIHLMALGNEKILLRHDILNYWPWRFLNNQPQQGEFLGRSEAEQLAGIQFAVNDLTNMSMENLLMSLTKMWIVGDEAEADLNQFVLEPMGVIQVADISQVKAESWADVNSSGMKLVQFLLQMGNQTSGIHDMLRGQTAPRQEFATTVMALQQASEARIDSQIKHGDKTWLSPTAQGFIECAQEELDEPEYLQGPDQTWEEIDMYSLQGAYEISYAAQGAGVKEIQRAGLNDMMATLPKLLPELSLKPRLDLAIAVAKTYEGTGELIENLVRFKEEVAAGVNPGIPGAGIPPGAGVGGPPGLDGLAAAVAGAQEGYSGQNPGAQEGMEPPQPVLPV